MLRVMQTRFAVASSLFLLLTVGTSEYSAALAQTTTTAPQAKAKVAEPAKKQAEAKKTLDLNKATADEMVEFLPGVGEVTAKKIVDGRPYTKVDDLAKAGVPARTIEGIRSLVTVAQPAGSATKKAAPSTKSETAKTKAAPAPVGKVNLNTATAEELQTLPGIGPAYAKAIIGLRPIKALSDLENIKGLSEERIEELDEHVVILAAAPKPTPTPTPAPAPTATPKTKAATKKAAATTKTATTGDLAPGQKININSASQDDLQLLPGIGPVKSKLIIEGRPYKNAEDIMKVKGIKEGSFAKIKDHIKVD